MTRVLVTRPAGQADELIASLSGHGIAAVHVPTVAIAPADDGGLSQSIAALGDGAWLVVTSTNGATAVIGAMGGRALPAGVRVAAVGPATAEALRAGEIGVDVMPDRYLTAAIAEALGEVRGRHILLARADAASPDLHAALLARGAHVDEVVAYRTIEGPPESGERLRDALTNGLDAILFTSGSTVRGLMALLPWHLRRRAAGLPALCIGPVTAAAARRAGFRVADVAADHTARGLAAVTASYFTKEAS